MRPIRKLTGIACFWGVLCSLFFFLTQMLMAALRSVETVRISLYISVVSLVLNCGINYTLIFGRFGFPEMGIRGAAIGTLMAISVPMQTAILGHLSNGKPADVTE